mgnify:FL=1|tara:strand:- start:424 stop:759 length:336 start_codon:yes stop_codon:yes gene_type:complete
MRVIITLTSLFITSCINMDTVIETGAKVKDKYEKFEEANPDFTKNIMSGDTTKIFESVFSVKKIKTDEQKAKEDSIAALEKAEQDSILKVMKESFIDELYNRYGSKKDTLK